ncbi:MAG: oxidoreductase family protein [Actinomycetota bacterium]|nr:oxidoreductase family protein [Actinomycetota bacterium]
MTLPSTVSEISTDWLNKVLPDEFGEITDFFWVDLGEGVGILGEVSRLHLTYAQGETGPETLVAKCQSPAEENISLCQTMGYYFREVNFYKHNWEDFPVQTPRNYFSEINESGTPFTILIEEIPDTTVMDQTTGADVERTASVFSILAKLHAHFWETDKLYALDWLPPMNNAMYKTSQTLAENLIDNFKNNWASKVDQDTLEAVEQFIPRYPEFLDWAVDRGNQTFTHNDARCENYLFSPDGSITMIDFQYCTRFWGAWDISNWLSASLSIQDRQNNGQELVNHYHKELVAYGVQNYSIDQCWNDLKASLVVQTYNQIIDSDLDYSNERGKQLLEKCVLRTFSAASDYEIASFIEEVEF